MVDHIRTLLINAGSADYVPVTDAPSERALSLFGVTHASVAADTAVVDVVLPLALAPDLTWFSSRFDQRITPPVTGSVYRTDYSAGPDLDGLYARVLGDEGRWASAAVFSAADPVVNSELSRLREASMGMDGPYALGAVLLACAYRRDILRTGGAL